MNNEEIIKFKLSFARHAVKQVLKRKDSGNPDELATAIRYLNTIAQYSRCPRINELLPHKPDEMMAFVDKHRPAIKQRLEEIKAELQPQLF